MRRHHYRPDNENPTRQIVATFCVIWLMIFLSQIFTNPDRGIKFLGYTALVVLAYAGFSSLLKISEKRRLSRLFHLIKERGLKDYVKNFINRFSFEGKNIDGWEFRNRKIDWDRINDLEKYLIENDIPLKTKEKRRDVFDILKVYIQIQEENLTRESIKKEPQKYSSLSGSDFEKLLYRLFDAMDYKCEPIGRSGDQGGDLIANKGGERILIQAKCYRDWSVGNEAVQQVVGAMKYYNCNKTMVITTSTNFTPEARALARANNTELVSKDRLSEMIMQFLLENWG